MTLEIYFLPISTFLITAPQNWAPSDKYKGLGAPKGRTCSKRPARAEKEPRRGDLSPDRGGRGRASASQVSSVATRADPGKQFGGGQTILQLGVWGWCK